MSVTFKSTLKELPMVVAVVEGSTAIFVEAAETLQAENVKVKKMTDKPIARTLSLGNTFPLLLLICT
jgi:hypothetical protein